MFLEQSFNLLFTAKREKGERESTDRGKRLWRWWCGGGGAYIYNIPALAIRRCLFFFIRETILPHTRVEEGLFCHFVVGNCSRSTPKDNNALFKIHQWKRTGWHCEKSKCNPIQCDMQNGFTPDIIEPAGHLLLTSTPDTKWELVGNWHLNDACVHRCYVKWLGINKGPLLLLDLLTCSLAFVSVKGALQCKWNIINVSNLFQMSHWHVAFEAVLLHRCRCVSAVSGPWVPQI